LPVPLRGIDRLTYLTFGNEAHLDMLAESLYSMARVWRRLPHLVIAWDGDRVPARLAKTLAFWPREWEMRTRSQVRALLDPRADRDLIAFGEREAMARKMAAVLSAARIGPTLYSDVDLLWFREPESLARWRALPTPALVMSPDFQASYDSSLISAQKLGIREGPCLCAGLMFASGDVLTAAAAEDMLAFAATHGCGVTEQTIFAESCRRLGGWTWPAEEIALEEADRFALAPTYRGMPWAARHYVGQIRHHFWRDALALRVSCSRG